MENELREIKSNRSLSHQCLFSNVYPLGVYLFVNNLHLDSGKKTIGQSIFLKGAKLNFTNRSKEIRFFLMYIHFQ